MSSHDKIKSKIIQVTVHEIRTNGYKNISLRGLVKRAHLTTGAFYKRFPNKKSLFLSITRIISLQVYHQILPEVNDYKKHPRQSLAKLGTSIIRLFNTEPNIMNFLFFNHELSSVYKNNQIGVKFPLLKLAKRMVFLNVDNKSDVNKEFVQLWSFTMGYCDLISNHICRFDPSLLKETLNQMLGDNINE